MDDNVLMDLRDKRWRGLDWINLVEGRNQWWALVNTAMDLRVP
jgi:hypothetical protein